MGYPLMLYRAGVALTDHRIVADEAEEAKAGEEGYSRLDMAAVKSGAALAVAEAPVKRGPGRPPKQKP